MTQPTPTDFIVRGFSTCLWLVAAPLLLVLWGIGRVAHAIRPGADDAPRL